MKHRHDDYTDREAQDQLLTLLEKARSESEAKRCEERSNSDLAELRIV